MLNSLKDSFVYHKIYEIDRALYISMRLSKIDLTALKVNFFRQAEVEGIKTKC